VNIIAPPIIKVSTLFIRLFIAPILSVTLDPPKIATNGLLGFSITWSNISTSFFIKKPKPEGKYFATPTVELCALCDVPKASFI